MYKYDDYDRKLVSERVAQFRNQTERFLAGELTEDEFRTLRLQNGLYIQRHAPMLRVAIPYGMLNSSQLNSLAYIADEYDRGYAHFTTRQNIQYNWPALENVPDILEELSKVEMHAIQTSGNCIRNTTSDPFAGIAKDELVDPRPYCEIIRQWSTFHPEFIHLPRKFKIAVNGALEDRAAVQVHDIGINLSRNEAGEVVAQVLAGGGLGRTPVIGSVIKNNLPWNELLTYIEAIMRVYNRYGRRDNLFKARIKILVRALGPEEFAKQVEAEWQHTRGGVSVIPQAELDRIAAYFTAPAYEQFDEAQVAKLQQQIAGLREKHRGFDRWLIRNVREHRQPGYVAVSISLKRPGIAPGNATSSEMRLVAKLAEQFSFGELRVTHEQNFVFSDVALQDLFDLWSTLKDNNLAMPNIGLVSDMIACPGGDFCSLANAKSIPIALGIQEAVDNMDYQFDLGDLSLNISGCINSCGHHHIGNIGILGVDKNGEEWYQVTLGGRQGNEASIGKVIGKSFYAEDVPGVVKTILQTYVDNRFEDELFIDTLDRIGLEPFKNNVYPNKEAA
ncbi:MAG TPA: nitrite/sulfite reductase [Limnobacter sp.]|uniref:nitrite/sulfite reductase n=1 Tax=Limnobacter sp. TaxID=2003368 RepID=UPI002E340C2D|nr:nitrite/sulfite reductase [Limnobacter sp.]HEX5484748.1 nitrite/sulfite reductase [Limnobacter sp.]